MPCDGWLPNLPLGRWPVHRPLPKLSLCGQECRMINPCLVKEISRKILCGSKAIMTEGRTSYLQCELALPALSAAGAKKAHGRQDVLPG